MLKSFSNIYFRIGGFFVAAVGTVFGGAIQAKAAVFYGEGRTAPGHIKVSPHVTSSDLSDCRYTQTETGSYKNSDGTLRTNTTVTLSDGTVYPYFCLLEWMNENRDVAMNRIMGDASVYGSVVIRAIDEQAVNLWENRLKSGESQSYGTCSTEELESSGGVSYYTCAGKTLFSTSNAGVYGVVGPDSFTVKYSTEAQDVAIQDYGASVALAYRLIGCVNTGYCMRGASSGATVTSLTGITCDEDFCNTGEGEDSGDTVSCAANTFSAVVTPVYSSTKGVCYIKFNDTVQNNLFDGKGHFAYVGGNWTYTGCTAGGDAIQLSS